MYRVGILLKDGSHLAENFPNKESADEWVLEQCEKHEVKKAIIVNKNDINDREIIYF